MTRGGVGMSITQQSVHISNSDGSSVGRRLKPAPHQIHARMDLILQTTSGLDSTPDYTWSKDIRSEVNLWVWLCQTIKALQNICRMNSCSWPSSIRLVVSPLQASTLLVGFVERDRCSIFTEHNFTQWDIIYQSDLWIFIPLKQWQCSLKLTQLYIWKIKAALSNKLNK